MNQLQSRTILIIGAYNGIGLAMTKALLERGDRTAALNLSLENLDQPSPVCSHSFAV